jgi:hypothetical protein
MCTFAATSEFGYGTHICICYDTFGATFLGFNNYCQRPDVARPPQKLTVTHTHFARKYFR